jgi:hypothetical protein
MVRVLPIVVALLLIAGIGLFVAARLSPGQARQTPPPNLAFNPGGCYGTLVVRLHSNRILRDVSYSLLINNETRARAYVNGTVEERRDTVVTVAEACGSYGVYVSWRRGPWQTQSALVAQGKTTSVEFSNG